jgi:hypothetical protein
MCNSAFWGSMPFGNYDHAPHNTNVLKNKKKSACSIDLKFPKSKF